MGGRWRAGRASALDLVSYALLCAIVAFALFPFVWTLVTSLKPDAEILSRPISYLPRQPSAANYVEVFGRTDFPRMFLNSAIVGVFTVALSLVLASLAGYSLARYRFRGHDGIMLAFLVTQMFPVVLLLVPLFLTLQALSLIDTYVGVVVAETAFVLPLCVWMLKGFFEAVPPELEDAARIDGCTRLGALVRVVLPLARPGLFATAIFAAIDSWNALLVPLMFTSSDATRTWPVGLQSFIGEFQMRWGVLSAAGVISIVPLVVFFALIQRNLVRGLMSGATKG